MRGGNVNIFVVHNSNQISNNFELLEESESTSISSAREDIWKMMFGECDMKAAGARRNPNFT